MWKNLWLYILFFFILNIVTNAISGGEPNFWASSIYFVLLGIWLIAIYAQKRKKGKSDAPKDDE
jgi:protein-S-isoprenylcysteine O-methyltransferase Ste14